VKNLRKPALGPLVRMMGPWPRTNIHSTVQSFFLEVFGSTGSGEAGEYHNPTTEPRKQASCKPSHGGRLRLSQHAGYGVEATDKCTS
jgi:hypothetical protein